MRCINMHSLIVYMRRHRRRRCFSAPAGGLEIIYDVPAYRGREWMGRARDGRVSSAMQNTHAFCATLDVCFARARAHECSMQTVVVFVCECGEV